VLWPKTLMATGRQEVLSNWPSYGATTDRIFYSGTLVGLSFIVRTE